MVSIVTYKALSAIENSKRIADDDNLDSSRGHSTTPSACLFSFRGSFASIKSSEELSRQEGMQTKCGGRQWCEHANKGFKVLSTDISIDDNIYDVNYRRKFAWCTNHFAVVCIERNEVFSFSALSICVMQSASVYLTDFAVAVDRFHMHFRLNRSNLFHSFRFLYFPFYLLHCLLPMRKLIVALTRNRSFSLCKTLSIMKNKSSVSNWNSARRHAELKHRIYDANERQIAKWEQMSKDFLFLHFAFARLVAYVPVPDAVCSLCSIFATF